MVSYRWGPDGDSELPRETARIINGSNRTLNRAWLDVDELIPGTPTAEAVMAAVKAARFRLVFLSRPYLRSANCRRELETLRPQPGRTLFFVYTTHRNEAGEELRPPSMAVKELQDAGHLVVPIDPSFAYGPGELLRAMIDSGAMANLLKERSPKINFQWAATASALCKKPSLCASVCVGLQRFPHVLLLPILSAILVWLFLDYYVHDTITLSLTSLYHETRKQIVSTSRTEDAAWRGRVIATSICACWCVSLCLQVYLTFTKLSLIRLVSIDHHSPLHELPDCAQLLLVLRQLHIIRSPVPVWNVVEPLCADERVRLHRVLKILEEFGAVHILSKEQAQVAATSARYDLVVIVDLDECQAHGIAPPGDMRASFMNFCVSWSTQKDYKGLHEVQDAEPTSPIAQWAPLVMHTIVAKPKRAGDMLESVLCRILQLALSDGRDLGVLGAPFMQKQVTDLQRCTRLYAGGDFTVPASDLAAEDAVVDTKSARFMVRRSESHNARISRILD